MRGRAVTLLLFILYRRYSPFFNIGDNERGRDRKKRSNTGIRSKLALLFLIEGDGESGQNRLAFLIEQIREKNHIENVPNLVEPCIVSDPNPPGASLP